MHRPLFLLLVAALVLPSVVEAQHRPHGQSGHGHTAHHGAHGQAAAGAADDHDAPAPTLADLDSILPKLHSQNPDEVREAIDLLSIIDKPAVIPHLAELLRSGQPNAITNRALEALAGLAHPSAIDVLTEFTHHRRAGARLLAYKALAAIDDPRIPALLEQGLHDSDRNVRATTALALGNIGARHSLDVLFQAFEHGVVEAAISIGKLGDKHAVDRFTGYLGSRPLSIMLSGYEQFLKRDDIPVETKTDIVARLGEVSGPMVRSFLEDYLSDFPEHDRSKLKRHVEDTLRRIPAGGGHAAAAAPTAPAGGEAAPAAASHGGSHAAPAGGPSTAAPSGHGHGTGGAR